MSYYHKATPYLLFFYFDCANICVTRSFQPGLAFRAQASEEVPYRFDIAVIERLVERLMW
jgi:hypothetical protein